MSLNLFQVDSFTSEFFRGNPAAVYLSKEKKPAAWMQALANEMNLSETAFVCPVGEKFELRWFTPTTEVNLCGHATLASAHILWERNLVSKTKTLYFLTRSGELSASKIEQEILLNFPAASLRDASDRKSDLEAALSRDCLVVKAVGKAYLVELESEDAVRSLGPNFSFMKDRAIPKIIATTRGRAGSSYDFVSRVFAPGSGIDEDPVTGSAHCALAVYWAPKLGKNEFSAFQASLRGGEMKVRLGANRVFLKGKAVTVFAGECFA